MTITAEQQPDFPASGELIHKILLATTELPGAAHRTLTYYVTKAPLGQTIREPAKDIAHALGLHEGSVSKSIRRLLAEGWLQVSYTVGSVSFYKAGPRIVELAFPQETREQPLAVVHHLPLQAPADAE
ncbi:hypothetical protein ACFW9F_14860 [Streptomyces sp. NPDC059506]|uniref:hypothetical protein n=1 Tax=Streptomyces sp. NPDC059506 TaxID=3347751 RepID=UPI003689D0FC